ncbi:hypothetical protein Taro_035622, partial [Colocasia esculenta]|nr:hypothetical protein [Colocasia esculenta]
LNLKNSGKNLRDTSRTGHEGLEEKTLEILCETRLLKALIRRLGASSGDPLRLEGALNIEEGFLDLGVQATSTQNRFKRRFRALLGLAEESFFGNLISHELDSNIATTSCAVNPCWRQHLCRQVLPVFKDMRKEGRHPTRPEIFQMTQARTAPNGSVMWSNEQSRQVMDQMTQLMNPTPSEESDGTAHLVVLTPEEAFRQTLRSWYEPSEGGSSCNTAYQRLLQEQSQQKSEMSQQKSEIERMKKIIEDQEQRIAAQSTDIDVRVEAQVEAQLEARVEARLAALQT